MNQVRFNKILSWVTLLIFQIICAIIIAQYDPKRPGWTSPYRLPKDWEVQSVRWHSELAKVVPNCINGQSYNGYISIPLLNSLLDPSTIVFTNAIIAFGIALLLSHNIRKYDQYQDQIWTVGTILGGVANGYLALQGNNIEPFKNYMPAIFIVTSVTSAWIHIYKERFDD